MGTEKFMAFKEDGTAYRLKGRILRFLDAEPVSSADKSNMRSSLGITSQGGLGDLLAANNLSDVSNAATSRANLDVNSTAQDAEAAGTKLVGPEMHFDGTSYMEFAANPALTPTTGSGATRQDTAFSFGTWIKLTDDYELSIGQYGTSGANRGWLLYMDSSSSPKFKFTMEDGSSNEMRVTSSTDYFVAGKWTHIAVTCTALSAASARQDDIKIYVNGKEIATTNFNVGYTGLTYSATQPLWIGKRSSTLSAFSQRDFKFFNKALSAAEVKTLCLSGSLPNSFSESTGTASLNTSTFASSTTSSRQFGAITGASSTGFTAAYNNANTNNRIAAPLSSDAIKGKKYKATFTVNTDGADVILRFFNAATLENTGLEVATINTTTATAVSYEWTETGSGDRIGFLDNSPAASGNLVVSSFRIIQIGSVLDARAEQFDTSTGKLYDLSGNGFVGTQSGGVSLLGRKFPVYETGLWTPSITFGGGSTGITYSLQEGYYTRIGDTVFISGQLTLTAKGSSTGTALISGLPFTSKSDASFGFSVHRGANMAALTSVPTAYTGPNNTTIAMKDWAATGVVNLDETNFTDTSDIEFSGTYKIQ